MVFPKRNEEQIAALGARYGLVTPFTSLMVLESLEQYVQHHIEPPATLPSCAPRTSGGSPRKSGGRTRRSGGQARRRSRPVTIATTRSRK